VAVAGNPAALVAVAPSEAAAVAVVTAAEP
jgi:hypothetical protein